jgi:uncharacterized protein (UPF0332 family)
MSMLWEKALEAAEEARLLFQEGHPNGTLSRAYYAVFTAARALLVVSAGYDEADIRRHSAVLRIFPDQFVKTGLVDRDVGRRFHDLSQERANADYHPLSVSEDDAKDAIEFMERFLSEISELRQQESNR